MGLGAIRAPDAVQAADSGCNDCPRPATPCASRRAKDAPFALRPFKSILSANLVPPGSADLCAVISVATQLPAANCHGAAGTSAGPSLKTAAAISDGDRSGREIDPGDPTCRVRLLLSRLVPEAARGGTVPGIMRKYKAEAHPSRARACGEAKAGGSRLRSRASVRAVGRGTLRH